MDIGDMSTYYTSQVTAQNTDVTANNISNLNASSLANASDEELMDACKQFESYFLEQVFKQMKKTVPQSEFTSSSTSQLVSYVEDEMVKEYASTSTENNSLGLAQMLYEQMKRNYGSVEPEAHE